MGDFRVEAWFKTTDTGRSILAGSYAGPVTSVNLELHTSNRGRIWIQGPTAPSDLNVTLPTNSRDNQWHHLAGVRQGNVVRLFYDGALVGSMTDAAGSFVISQPAMYVGRDNRLGDTVFNGALDNVRFYASADTSVPDAAYDFETTAGVLTVEGQAAVGQIDETAHHAGTPLHATGFSAQVADGIDYVADRPAVLTDSTVSLRCDENNASPEFVRIGMTQAIADLTLGDFSMQTWFKSTDTARGILMGSYDDGFIAYLNGVEVQRSNNVSPASNDYDAVIAANQEATTYFVEFDVSAFRHLLLAVDNDLAIHGVNRELDSSDFLMLPELVGGVAEENPSFDPIYFTFDGTDPRLSDGTIISSAMLYAGAVSLSAPTHVLARARDASGVWSALGEATYSLAMPIRVSELMYHPGPRSAEEIAAGFTSDEDFEFVELLNISPTATIDIAGVRFTEGIEFTFGDVELAPGGQVVLAQRADAFAFCYGSSIPLAGEYGVTAQQYRRSNSGERLTLVDAVGVVIQTFDFDDGWYPQSDGDGFSLVARDESAVLADWNDAAAWRSSFASDGSPGTPDRLPGDVNGDLRVDLADVARLQANLGVTSGAMFADGDFNGDGAVNRSDLAVLARHFGRNEAPALPAASSILASAGAVASRDPSVKYGATAARRADQRPATACEAARVLSATQAVGRRPVRSQVVDVALQSTAESLRDTPRRPAILGDDAAPHFVRALRR